MLRRAGISAAMEGLSSFLLNWCPVSSYAVRETPWTPLLGWTCSENISEATDKSEAPFRSSPRMRKAESARLGTQNSNMTLVMYLYFRLLNESGAVLN
jgi:hypothetical protein